MYSPPANLKSFPCRYIGSKRDLLPHVLAMVPPGTKSFYEPFGGTGCVSWALNQSGVRVIVSDVLHAAHLRHRALIENCGVTLSAEEIRMLTSLTPDTGPFQEGFQRIFGPENARFMDGLVEGIPLLDQPIKQDIAAIIPVLIAFNVLHFTNHRYSALGGLIGGADLIRLPLKEKFTEWAEEIIPALIAGNTQGNQVLLGDGVKLVGTVQADCAYFDPPYSSKPKTQTTTYGSIYAVWEDVTRLLLGGKSKIALLRDIQAHQPLHTKFERPNPATIGFMDLFEGAEHIPTLIISCNTTSGISPEAIGNMARCFGRTVEMKSWATRLPNPSKGKDPWTDEVLIRATKTVTRAAARKASAIGPQQTILDCKSGYPAKVGRNSFAANKKRKTQ